MTDDQAPIRPDDQDLIRPFLAGLLYGQAMQFKATGLLKAEPQEIVRGEKTFAFPVLTESGLTFWVTVSDEQLTS